MNLQEHQTLQLEIPDYVTSRLGAEAIRRVEAHLAACEECADLVETGRTLVAAAGEPDALLQDHPAPTRLMRYGLGEATGTDDAGLERHLANCVSCRLEVEVWRRQDGAPGFGLDAGGARGVDARARRPWLARNGFAAATLAAGLMLGVGLTALLQPRDSGWSGAVPLVVLEPPLRGDDPSIEVRVAPGQPYVPLAAAPVLPAGTEAGTGFRFELVDSGGNGVWSIEMTASELQGPLRTTGAVSFLVPASTLAPGRYRLRFAAIGATEPLLETPFVVVAGDD